MRNTIDLLGAAVVALEAAIWPVPDGTEQPAFAAVKLWDSTDLEQALTELLLSNSRVAFVVFLDESWRDQSSAREISVHRQISFSVLVSDRQIGNHYQAVFGGASNPGAITLKDIVISALTGRLVQNPDGIDVVPVRATPLVVQQDDQPGRVAYEIEFQARGGWINKTTGPGPVA